MNTAKQIIIYVCALFLVVACKKEEARGVLFPTRFEDYNFQEHDRLVYEIDPLPDGGKIVQTVQTFGVSTCCFQCFDADGRLVGWWSACSESACADMAGYQMEYDDGGRLSRLIFMTGVSDENLGIDMTEAEETEIQSDYQLTYNESGQIVRIVDTYNVRSITAPEGYQIVLNIVETENFWESCLHGGELELQITFE